MVSTMTQSHGSPSTVRSSIHLADDGFEYLVVTVGSASASAAAQRGRAAASAKEVLVERSEQGRWELMRTVLYQGGVSRHWMRRRVTKVSSTLRN